MITRAGTYACRRVRKDAAPGIEGETVAGYGEALTENLQDFRKSKAAME